MSDYNVFYDSGNGEREHAKFFNVDVEVEENGDLVFTQETEYDDYMETKMVAGFASGVWKSFVVDDGEQWVKQR